MVSSSRAYILLIATALSSSWTGLSAMAQQAPGDADQTGGVEISGPGGGGMLDEIVVTGEFIPDSVRATPEVISVLSREDIARTGDGDVAGALQRVTGLSVVGGKYVYVRGLGERYSLALLNGSPLPSPEPLRRVIPLDLFPTSLLASSVVQKSYSVNYPAEFGGGVVNLTTRSVPEEPFLEFSVGVGGNSETTLQTGYTHYGSGSDWTGFDGGARSPSDDFQAALDSGKRITEGADFSRDEMKDLTASLSNSSTNLIQRNDDIPFNGSLEMSGGTYIDFSSMRLGVIASLGYDNSWRTRGGIKQEGNASEVVNGQLIEKYNKNFTYLSTENRIVLNGMLGTTAEFGNNKIRWTNLFIRDTLKESRIEDGFTASFNEPQNISYTNWYERQLINTQLVGEFRFDDISLDLRGTYAKSERDAPYERVNTYIYSEAYQDYYNDLAGGTGSTISFSELNDTVWNGAIDVAYKVPSGFPLALSAGYYYLDNTRDSVRRDFKYVAADGIPAEVSQQRPDYLLSDYNIYTYDITLQETSGSNGAAAYDAGLKIHAGYLQAEIEPVPGLRVQGGVRYEDGRQFVTVRDLFGTGLSDSGNTRIEKSYWLPAATVTWNFYEDMQLRLAGSKTLARPQFRELAPQQYRDYDSDRTFQGNQFLIDSSLINADARYEWYISKEDKVSLALFYKSIDRPIENVAFESGDGTISTYANAPKARLYGAELEGEKYVALDGLGQPFFAPRRLRLAANYTYSDSKISVKDGDTTIVFDQSGASRPANQYFRDGAQMTGQSKHVGNIQVSLENQDRLSQQTLIANYASKRVTNRGPSGSPDYFEKPGFILDFVWREGMTWRGTDLELKLEARNLLDTDYIEYQDNGVSTIYINRYQRGRSFSASFSTKF